ncbi:MAG: hypothetical protein ALMCE001_10760 [Methanocorpusculum sp. MCE]|nr:MAG: hypothetical protein ALMCE001_18450 [Methanocorpusculum sp. MCE]RBQ23810.1 MAG: hypothetical protein ALMCE001_15650 [Methanocorpusculum sp. MCE]RBQ23831.1 MAG: hypothetical protein ALMCE001_15470 [Methanocorpusculum sp. MCE]RBQ24287.1 MAG: hypothetical protein ALMCE001_13650 [Methanocorpusculum sp. MCE]RBQ24428.1 MAG: hypothetical protein ALMCE001_12920 [Methanocorpusculum sp. MCE]
MALLKLSDKYSQKKLEEACKRVLSYTGKPSLKGVQAVLKSGIIGLKSVDMPDKPVTSKYGITRGPHYYQRNDD